MILYFVFYFEIEGKPFITKTLVYIFRVYCRLPILWVPLSTFFYSHPHVIRKAAKKFFFFVMARPLKGGGVRAWPLRKPNLF